LIRALEPLDGGEIMAERRNKKNGDPRLTTGPGALTAALGITTDDDGVSLQSARIWLEERFPALSAERIITTTRVGVDYAGIDALLPYRFYLADSPFVSKNVDAPAGKIRHEK